MNSTYLTGPSNVFTTLGEVVKQLEKIAELTPPKNARLFVRELPPTVPGMRGHDPVGHLHGFTVHSSW